MYDTIQSNTFQTISPVDGSVYVEREYATDQAIEDALRTSRAAQVDWRLVPIAERAAYCSRFVEAFTSRRDEIAREISWQIGRPIAHSPGEVRGVAERANYMIGIAATSLAD